MGVIDGAFFDRYRKNYATLPQQVLENTALLSPVVESTFTRNADDLAMIIANHEKRHCVMRVTADEIMTHQYFIDNVLAAHYIRAKITGMQKSGKYDFPDACCDYSTVNVFLSLLQHGYQNAMMLYTQKHGHMYVGVPFVVGNEEGIIIADPTAEQTWRTRRPRTLVTVRSRNWRYKTDWRDGADLYPDWIGTIETLDELCRMTFVKDVPVLDTEDDALVDDVKGVLGAAYKNPKTIKTPLASTRAWTSASTMSDANVTKPATQNIAS